MARINLSQQVTSILSNKFNGPSLYGLSLYSPKFGGRVCHGPSLLWAEFVMGRVCYGPRCPGILTNKRTSKIQASYKLEGTVLENVESIKYLGVTITKDLKWNTYISNVCTKANRTLGLFRRNLFS